jgi:hypothetical protein
VLPALPVFAVLGEHAASVHTAMADAMSWLRTSTPLRPATDVGACWKSRPSPFDDHGR